jgi:inorganic triphosphatase YgiF
MNNNSNFENELKLHIPNVSVAGLEKMLLRGKINSLALRALYFDTDDRALANHKISLRLRQEDEQWVQTLKILTHSLTGRIELNHDRPCAELDLGVYKNTVAENVISKIKSPLRVRYETQVKRMFRNTRTATGLVEIAYDCGCIRSGSLELPVSEVEFELKRGDLESLFTVAKKWQKEHHLILDVRSKAERGDLLCQLKNKLIRLEIDQSPDQLRLKSQAIEEFWLPRLSKQIQLRSDMTTEQGLKCVMSECLNQIIRNAAAIAEVDTANKYKLDTTEHIHQLRVGIRRLRTAWSYFESLCPLPTLEHRESLKHHFGLLGGSRDQTVLLNGLMPALISAGQPILKMEFNSSDEDSSLVTKDSSFQSCILSLCAFVEATTSVEDSDKNPIKQLKLKKCLPPRLKKWHKKIISNSRNFAHLTIEARHDLRKRVKKLRYAFQFTYELLPSKKLDSYQKELGLIQNLLGEMNDLTTALDKFSSLKESQPSAWFACGWISNKLANLELEIIEAFHTFESNKYWY